MTDINFKVDGNWTNAALAIYKVGAIYMSVDSTSPATLFGGTWVALEGRMLIGANSTYAVGTTGGSKTTTLATNNLPAHAHSYDRANDTSGSTTLNINQIPSHNHRPTADNTWHFSVLKDISGRSGKLQWTSAGVGYFGTASSGGYDDIGMVNATESIGGNQGHTHSQPKTSTNTGNTGSGTAFDTISPYLAVYMWKRTA